MLKSSPYIRLFVWCWEVENPKKLNICHLFWGTIFLPTTLYTGRKICFIPGASYFCILLGIGCIYEAGWKSGIFFIFLGSIIAFISITIDIIKYIRNKIDDVDNKETIKILNKLTNYGSRFDEGLTRVYIAVFIGIASFIWLSYEGIKHCICRPTRYIRDKRYKPIIKLCGLFYVMYEYIRSVKEGTCKKPIWE